MTGIRIYGHKFGQGSFTQVTNGFRLAANELGLLEGFVPVDGLRDDLECDGAQAKVAVNCGSPSATAYATTMGVHEQRWLMLAPNSDQIPESMVKWLPKYITGLLSPSLWGKQVLEQFFPQSMPVLVCPHGVHPAFTLFPEHRAYALDAYRKGEFQVVHLTSTNAERKGTRELLDAWKLLMEQDVLPERARLIIIAPMAGIAEQHHWIVERGLETAIVVPELGLDHHTFARWLSSRAQLVCQPSRGEGFGLVPLEARALGIPCAATSSTGHSEHFPATNMLAREFGCEVIASGADAALDDLPQAMGPKVAPGEIARAISRVYGSYEKVALLATIHAEQIGRDWSWTAKTGPVLETLVAS
jgi:glycosyltransferase involved in cell wall biosynthesis